jgi:putative tryptophan/tyrosine transport system substrate-binding protein
VLKIAYARVERIEAVLAMQRREFIALVGGAAAAWPLAARAQPSKQARQVGMLIASEENEPLVRSRVASFRQGLSDLGWIEGGNLQIAYCWTGNDPERTRRCASELVALGPEVILSHSPPATSALSKATQSIPIVFVQITDPVGAGLVANLAHPGANITGFTTFEFSMGTKWLDLLKGIAPNLTRVAVMQYANSPTWFGQLQAVEAAAPSLGTQIIPAGIENAADIERSIAEIGREANGGLIVMPDSITLIHRKLIVSLAERYRLPAIYPFRYFPDEGGLVSYGIDLADVWRRSATYVDRILRGSAAGDLPVQQPTKFELVVNLRAAKTLGLEISPTLLARADEVIE